MKVPIQQPLDPQSVLPTLQAMLPGYKLSMRGGKIIVAEKSAAVGATIFFQKKKLVVNGNFPNMGLQMVFVLSVVFLGILIPLIIYFATVYRSQKTSEQEVGAALQAMLNGAQPQPGYAQQGYPQPGQLPPGYPPQQGYAQPGQPQPGYPPQQGYAQPGQPPQGYPPQQM